ncbi:MAG: PaaI family thioesterase [Dehalococcoidia bacterium]|nr:PaaI family thioesterase [Dehalococcoidia bacterium]
MPESAPRPSPALNDRTDYQRCFACGQRNAQGLKLKFRREGAKVVSEFVPQPDLQGYPGLLHGGVLFAALDETMGRVPMLERQWMVTAKVVFRHRKPVHIGDRLRIEAELLRRRERTMEVRARALLPDGSVAAEAEGLLARIPDDVWRDVSAVSPSFKGFFDAEDV